MFGLNAGKLDVGCPADLVIVDLEKEAEVNPDQFLSKSRNTPFVHWRLKGWPLMTIAKGRPVWTDPGAKLEQPSRIG